ncbi:MAG: RDD family protein [Candidatus Omnitrophica bacterium]|nr:RDD family protein [Candidatus Omnitrophota bacterium]
MVEEIKGGVVGGSSEPEAASKGKRFLAAIFDLVVIPVLLGVVAGLILLNASVGVRNGVLIIVNVFWMSCRDLFNGAGPGKRMAGIKVISAETKQPLTFANWGQGFMRNILLVIPFVLIVGYIIEIIFLITKGERICDKWAKTKVVVA